MKTIDLANLIRSIRKDKLDEQHGGMGKFKGGAADLQDPGSSPNRVVGKSTKELHHKLEEEDVDEQLARSSFGRKHNPTSNVFTKGKTPADRAKFQGFGNQGRRVTSYVSEEDFEGGKTSTGQVADTITTKTKTDSKTDKVVADKINTIKEQNKKRK